MSPDHTTQCGPYHPTSDNDIRENWINETRSYEEHKFGSGNHDTIGMIIVDLDGNIVAGTSTNGARHKIPG